MAWDEYGNWVEDDAAVYGYGDQAYNQFLPASYPGDLSTYGNPQAYDAATLNRQLTGVKNLTNLQADPRFMYDAMVATGQPTMDINALLGLDRSGNPYLGSGGGGGGGGGSGYKSVFTTPYNDSLAMSDDPVDQLVFKGIQSGMSPTTIKKSVRDTFGDLDSDSLYAVNDVIDQAFSERASYERNELEGANAQPAQTPIQEWLDKYGLINPLEQYSAENLPGDVDTSPINPYLQQMAGSIEQAQGIADRNEGAVDRLRTQQRLAVGRRALDNQLEPMTHTFGSGGGGAPATGVTAPGLDQDAVSLANGGDPYGQAQGQQQGGLMGRISGALNAGRRMGQAAAPSGDVPGGFMGQLLRPAFQAVNEQRGKTPMELRQLARQSELSAKVASRPARLAAKATKDENDYRTYLAKRANEAGRTPARDARSTMLNYLRQQGIGV